MVGSRRAVLFAVVVLVIGLAGFVGGSLMPRQSLAVSDADAIAPVVTAEVEQRVVANLVAIQGSVAPGQEVKVAYDSVGEPGVLPYVTKVNKSPGDEVASGSVLMAIAGEPRMVLQLASPLYRSLRVGDSGDDVEAFEAALAQLVAGDFDVDGTFTENTMLAASELWERNGFELPLEAAEATPAPAPSSPPTATGQPSGVAAPEATQRSYVDVHDVVQVSSPTVRVDAIAAVGELATQDEPLAVLKSVASEIRFDVSVLHENAFAVGAEIELSSAGLPAGRSTVASLGELVVPSEAEATTRGAGRAATAIIPSDWKDVAEGTPVQISPAVGQEPVLAIPITAIRDAAGNPYVTLGAAVGDDADSILHIEVLSTGDGWAQISPDSGLHVGDVVRISP